MKKFAVVGNPIAHSKSPFIHQAFAEQLGIELSYEKILIPTDEFEKNIGDLAAKGMYGLNVTAPYKQQAWQAMQEKSERAEMAQAVNTIYFRDKNDWYGDNSDGIGLLNDLIHNQKINLTNKKILILGAGGATRGILMPLLSVQPREILIANRTLQTAMVLSVLFQPFGNVKASSLDDLQEQRFDLIINATSASIQQQELPLNPIIFQQTVCYDLAYGPSAQLFLQQAQRHGASKTLDGLGMLVEQAAESFYLWHGKKPQTREVIDELRNV